MSAEIIRLRAVRPKVSRSAQIEGPVDAAALRQAARNLNLLEAWARESADGLGAYGDLVRDPVLELALHDLETRCRAAVATFRAIAEEYAVAGRVLEKLGCVSTDAPPVVAISSEPEAAAHAPPRRAATPDAPARPDPAAPALSCPDDKAGAAPAFVAAEDWPGDGA